MTEKPTQPSLIEILEFEARSNSKASTAALAELSKMAFAGNKEAQIIVDKIDAEYKAATQSRNMAD